MAQSDILPAFFAVFDDTIDRADTAIPFTRNRYKILGAMLERGFEHSPIKSYSIYRPSVTMADRFRGMKVEIEIREEHSIPSSVTTVIMNQEDGTKIRDHVWYTTTYIRYRAKDVMIPVLGFGNSSHTMGKYLYDAEGDTESACRERCMSQMANRIRAAARIQARETPQPSPQQPPPQHTFNPRPPVYEMVRATAPPPPSLFYQSYRPPPITIPQRTLLLPSLESPPPIAPFAPRHVLEILKQDAISKGDSCPISFTPFAECSSITVTSCFHLFETEALDTWLATKQLCPACKQIVKGKAHV